MDPEEHKKHIEMKLRVLGYGTIGGILVILFWALSIICCGDLVFKVHTLTFEITRAQFDAINYAGIMIAKMLLFFFFLLPWISLKLALKKQKSPVSES